MRVLVIEDEQRLAENIVAALREIGLAVDHAANGVEGSHLAEQGVYDAMVLDLMLPGKTEQTVVRRGVTIDLSPTEYRVLEYLIHRPRAIVSKQELLEHLYDFEWEHHSNVIEAHVSNLRRKLNIEGTEPLIETLRHRGYRLREGASAA